MYATMVPRNPFRTTSLTTTFRILLNDSKWRRSPATSRSGGEVGSSRCYTRWAGLSEPFWERELGLQLSRTHILRFCAGISDQHRQTKLLYRRMRKGAAQGELSRNNGERCFGARPRLHPTRGVASPLPRYGASQGSPRLVQGRRWVMVAWKSQREYD